MKTLFRLIAPVLLALAAAMPAHAAGSQIATVPHLTKGPFPQLTLTEGVARTGASGERALQLLGTRLPEVAAWYGKSPDEFRALFRQDRRMRLDQRGRVFVVDELEAVLPSAGNTASATTGATITAAASGGLLDGTLAPLDQTFLLHSKPGASRTIYLNFKGATLTGTAWNSNGNTITAAPYDLDGLPYSNSTAELQRIQYIWQRVAEDYAAFDVDVTTEAPSADQLTRSSTSDTVFGTTVLITNRTGVYSCSCGGVAYLGVFDDTSNFYKPALVFYDALGAGHEKYVAEAISHEAGHNMGLGHDGTATSGYYGGHGSGATGWAPIMGVGYYQALAQWSKGEYPGATNVQDDYAVMQSNGLPLRADDHGSTAATATVLAGTTNGGITSASAQGVIERPTDVDMFSFAAGAGSTTITLTPAVRSPNLDALLTLRNSAGTVLATANPVDAVNATLSFTLPAAGTYTVSVQGTGKGDPLTTGYTNYGSIGQYALTASYPATTGGNVAPVAVISASAVRGTAPFTVNFSGAGSTDDSGSIAAYAWNFGDGGTASGMTAAHIYTTPGTYSAQLQVTDAGGLSGSTTMTITVDAPVTVIGMRVADIAMSRTLVNRLKAYASAAVRVVDSNGNPVAGAVVTGDWGGIVYKVGATATTDASGVASFRSPTTQQIGNFVFSVTGVARSGYNYTPGANTETSDSVAR